MVWKSDVIMGSFIVTIEVIGSAFKEGTYVKQFMGGKNGDGDN